MRENYIHMKRIPNTENRDGFTNDYQGMNKKKEVRE